MPDYKLVQINLSETSLKQVERLQALLNAKNRTDAITRVIDLTLFLLDSIAQGKSLILESDSVRERVVIPGAHQIGA